MSVSISISPVSTSLTLRNTVKTELEITVATHDDFIDALIYESSEWISSHLGRPLYRAEYSESVRGADTRRAMLSRYPLVAVGGVTFEGAALTLSSFAIENARVGFLDYESGWAFSRNPLAYDVTYTAGYFLPGDDLTGSMDVASADQSFNSSALFHPHLKPGDSIYASGFTAAANNGLHQVSTATTSKIVVTSASTLVLENSASRTLGLRNLPGPIERACIDLVKSIYQSRAADVNAAEVKVGDVTIKSQPQAVQRQVMKTLRPYAPL